MPLSIVFGFALVAAAIFFGDSELFAQNAQANSPERSGKHRLLYGEKRAPITIVEFSDFECPFCARLHPTLKRLVDESNGEVNWEYRHFPLPNHRNAEYAAVVAECVARKLTTEAFWQYSDRVFENVSRLNESLLHDIAADLGLSEAALTECSSDESIREQIARDVATARAFGGGGTPFSLVVFEDGSVRPVSGALPHTQWQALLTR